MLNNVFGAIKEGLGLTKDLLDPQKANLRALQREEVQEGKYKDLALSYAMSFFQYEGTSPDKADKYRRKFQSMVRKIASS